MTFLKCAHTQPCSPHPAHSLDCAAMLNIPYVLGGENRLSFIWRPLISICSYVAYLSACPLHCAVYLAVTLTINASFRHSVSQSIVKSIQLFMRNVCQMYLTDALLAYTPCLPTCSTVETSTTVANIRAYQHIYIHTYPSHPHTHTHTYLNSVNILRNVK